ncbi:MAG TPA: type II CAAX endopeptidase family protein [Candidatus Angelobacter sp.]|nr:type II CAAX endopeptidase family protein [Candidatus Angelobacter sp.]
MQTQAEDATQSSSVPDAPAPDRKLIAPLWHTVLFVLLLFANSYFTAKSLPRASAGASPKQRAFEYLFTIGWELVLLLIVWFGIRLRGVTLRELVGGRWKRVEDFLLDVGIAGAAVVGAYIVVLAASFAFGLATREHIAENKKLADMLAPSSLRLLALFVVMSGFAGVIEEILFRGYLQKQFAALTGKLYVGVLLQAVVFGLGHGYEGWQRMAVIVCLGCFFAGIAVLRKSLRPGMMAHAMFDSLQGLGLYAIKKGLVRTP